MVLIMSKKKVFLLLVSLVFMGLFSNFASAQEEGAGLGEAFGTIRELFAFLPELVTLEKLIGGDTAAIFWAKFLVWLLLFAVLFFGASKVFPDNNRIAVIVALVIALMGTLLIPYPVLVNIFQTYGLVAGIVVWAIPLIAGMYIAHKFENPFARALIYGLAAWILFSINNTVVKEQGFANTNFPFFGLLLAVVIILFFWNLGQIFGIGGDGAGGGRAGDIGRDFMDWATGRGDRGRRGDGRRGRDGRYRAGRDQDRGQDRDRDRPSRDDDKEKDIDKKELIEEKKFFGLLRQLYKGICRISPVSAAKEVKKKLKRIQNEIIILGNLNRKEEKAEKLTEEYLTELGFSKTRRGEILKLIKYEETSLRRVYQLFEDLQEAVGNVLEGENKRKDYVVRLSRLKNPGTIQNYTGVIIPGVEEVIKDNSERLKSDLFHMVRIIELLIKINLEELRKLK